VAECFSLKRTLRSTSFAEERRTRPDLQHWLSRSPEEHLAAVEFLRQQFHGSRARLRRVYRVVDCPWAEFLIVWAYALAFHGAPRFTGDLDILIQATDENTGRVLTAIRAFGCPVDD
jgi:hypothetical protein